MPDKKSSRRSFYVYLAVIAFVLNWIWEIGQIFAYSETAEKSVREMLFFCTLAGAIDALTILGICGAAKMFFRLRDWKFYLTTVLLGALCAVIFEKIAFTFGWWNYSEQMPVVPFVGTGLLPFMQLTILAPLSIWLAARWRERRMAISRTGGNKNGK